jgi:hypothetical protein
MTEATAQAPKNNNNVEEITQGGASVQRLFSPIPDPFRQFQTGLRVPVSE